MFFVIHKISKIISSVFLLLFLIGILYIKFTIGVFSWTLIAIYASYVLFIFFMFWIGTKELSWINRDIDESEELMKLRMNHSLMSAIYAFSVSIAFIFEGIKHLDKYCILAAGIILFIIGSIQMTYGYLARFRRLEKIMINRMKKKIVKKRKK